MILSSFQDNYGDHNSYIVFIDEGEVGFHPSWKKKYLSWLLDFFNSQFNKYSIQLILTTHSPYLLSDLPPENCILLRKSKLRQPEQVPENELKTFGANIHELLATSFFLQDGLIGDFAKKTIQTVIDFLNTWKKGVEINKGEKEFVKYVISIVSDEIVRFKLLDMYNEIFYDETIIEDEILEMQKRIESLKKMRDDRN
ncbi:MAG: AAA family ATPase [Bacteroidetes bacterium]|nr:AAA family ATPase [Bacteroidota bacterium]